LFAGGFLAALSPLALVLPLLRSEPRSWIAANPCCLHNRFTVSKSASFDAASNFAFSSASAFSCVSISISHF